MFDILEGTIINTWPGGMAAFQIHNFGKAIHIQVWLPDSSKLYLSSRYLNNTFLHLDIFDLSNIIVILFSHLKMPIK